MLNRVPAPREFTVKQEGETGVSSANTRHRVRSTTRKHTPAESERTAGMKASM